MTWKRPHPSPALMRAMSFVNQWFLLRGLPVAREIPGVRDLPFARGRFRIRTLDIPAADLARLRSAVNPGTAAFIGPNHPEFGTDWMIDKDISMLVAPTMASWADRGIVAAAPKFWGMNNLIANDGGDDARGYSVEWALKGHAVLLHPEGSVHWTNDYVHPLFPGIAQMAIAAAEQQAKPVFIVPVVWKYRFIGDVSSGMHAEMRFIERTLGLESGDGLDTGARFAALQRNVLARQMQQFGFDPADTSGEFFARQLSFQQLLIAQLDARYNVESSDDVERHIARLGRAVRDALKGTSTTDQDKRRSHKHDLRMTEEAKRLGEFPFHIYGAPTFTQEQVYESLKRIRDRLIRRGWKNVLANTLPSPYGARVVHVGVPEPVRVTQGADEQVLLDYTRTRMQVALDDINQRIESGVSPFRVPNNL